MDEPVQGRLGVDRALPRPHPLQPRVAPAQQHHGADVDGGVDQRPHRGEPVGVGDTEDHAQDDLESEGVHPVQRAEGRTVGPVLGLVGGQLRDELAVALERLPVERRHQQLARPLVLHRVLQEQRVPAHDRAEDRVALAGVEHLGVAGEDLARVLGPREEDQRPTAGDQPDGEHVAVRPLQVGVEPVPEAHQRRALHQHRPPGAGRQPGTARRRQVAGADGGAAHAAEAVGGEVGGVGELVRGGHGHTLGAASTPKTRPSSPVSPTVSR